MSFSSPIFLFAFLPLVLTAYLLVPGVRARNVLLLFASLVFYAWGEGAYVLLLLLSVAMNHGFGLWMERVRGRAGAGWALAVAIGANLGLLAGFKYSGFFTDNVNAVLQGGFGFAGLERPVIHLPIGLSFFTFQAMSYVLDVYMRGERAQRNPLHTAVFIAGFPQLILGPIIRYRHIAEEITHRFVTAEGFATGARRFVMGLGKKVLIADTLAIAVDGIYALPSGELTPGLAWLAAACFTLQLYYDFSGYSDMAIGLGRMLGFHFRENFNYPLWARSRSDFFRRWNLSFFSWMRDYLFVPLAGRGRPYWREQLNVMIVFFLVGLWHGASWLFVLWGVANGALIVLERVWLLRHLQRMWRPVQHGWALGTTMVSLTFFRAGSLDQAWEMLKGLAGFAPGSGEAYQVGLYLNGQLVLAMTIAAVFAAPVYPALTGWAGRAVAPRIAALPAPAQAALAVPGLLWFAALLAVSASAVAARTYTPFIYFQF